MATATAPVSTIEKLRALPEDGLRHELLDGVHVMTPAPAIGHQRILGRLYLALKQALEQRPDLEILWSPADIVLGPRTLVQPDLFVIQIDPQAPPGSWSDVGVPILVIEALSPGTASRDRGAKRRIYQQAGVREYWIVDPDACLIERWTPADVRPEILNEQLEWEWEGIPRLALDMAGLFR